MISVQPSPMQAAQPRQTTIPSFPREAMPLRSVTPPIAAAPADRKKASPITMRTTPIVQSTMVVVAVPTGPLGRDGL